jgi:hypothetical protein
MRAEEVTKDLANSRIKGFVRPLRNENSNDQLGDRDGYSFIYHYNRDVVITWVQSPDTNDYSDMVLALDRVLNTSR